MAAFNWFQIVPGVGHHYEHTATLAAASSLIILSGVVAKMALGKGEAAIVPTDKISVRAFYETLTAWIYGLCEKIIGHHGKVYAPLFAAIFATVFLNNIVGLLPGMTPATENLNTTLAMGIIIFLFFNYEGIRAQGFINYIKHFGGPVGGMPLVMAIPMFLLIFPIEIISTFVRPVSLGFRLANVMTGDHVVMGAFAGMVPYIVPIPFYLFGLFVCFIQAFVFTLMSMVYVALATSHEEHH
ncbi:MAG: F0F1 ATP synthase subunit A [Pseudobdellovibrionaceae bacterium]